MMTARYMTPRPHEDLSVDYVNGSMWQMLSTIAQGRTGNLTPQEYVRQHLERLADPTQHIKTVGGTK